MTAHDNAATTTDAADGIEKAATMVRLGSVLPVVIAACVGCSLSIGAYFITARMEDRGHQTKIEREADAWFDQIEKKIDHTISVLRSIEGLYAASHEVERDEFRSFVRTLGEQQAVQALEWIPRVPQARRAAFEEAARNNGFLDFVFTERQSQGNMVRADTRAEYFPVYFIQPYVGNQAALGFDLGSNAARLEALNRARDSGEMVATSRITLVQETGNQYGFLVFIPIYRNGAPRDTVAERRANLMGFGLGVFRIGDLITGAIAEISSSRTPAVIQMFDQSAPEENRRLYPKTPASDGDAELLPYHRNTRTLSVAGRSWLLVATPTATFIKEISSLWRPWLVLLAGLLITVLLALYLKLITSHTREVENLVEERTFKLTRVNEDLEQFAYVASHDLKAPLRAIDNLAAWIEDDIGEQMPDDSRDHLRLLRSRIGRLEALLNGLLQYSRSGRDKAEVIWVDTQDLVHEVAELLNPPKTMQIKVSEDLPQIFTAQTPLQQIFHNLIGNAIKHHDRETGIIEITCRDLDSQFEFSVIDDGPGIPEQYHKRIFQMFQTLKRRDEVEGSGIGLAVVEKLVRTNGGTITVAMKECGRGAEFRFTWNKHGSIEENRHAA